MGIRFQTKTNNTNTYNPKWNCVFTLMDKIKMSTPLPTHTHTHTHTEMTKYPRMPQCKGAVSYVNPASACEFYSDLFEFYSEYLFLTMPFCQRCGASDTAKYKLLVVCYSPHSRPDSHRPSQVGLSGGSRVWFWRRPNKLNIYLTYILRYYVLW